MDWLKHSRKNEGYTMPIANRTATKIRQQYAVPATAFKIPQPSGLAAPHWRGNFPPTLDMALTLQRGQMISSLAKRIDDCPNNDPSYRHYYQVSQKSLAEQFRHWVESQTFDKYLDTAGEQILWANSRLLARRGLAASRDLLEHHGQPKQPVHVQLFELYADSQYPCLNRIAKQQNKNYAEVFNPMHRGWALRRTARDLQNFTANTRHTSAALAPIQPLNSGDAVAMLKDLFSWYYGSERQCLHTNLMPQRSWSRFCRKTDIVEGVNVAELYAAAKHLVEQTNVQHGVDFSEQHDVLMLRIALLQITQWWLLTDSGRLFS